MKTVEKTVLQMRFSERLKYAAHPLVKQLFQIIEEKQSNLAFNPDVIDKGNFLKLVDQVGPFICMLKTHIDIIENFEACFINALKELAEKHQFLIFEDRKFTDIGSVVVEQYQGGVYRIADWAHVVNAVPLLPGPSVVAGLAKVGVPKGRGLLLLAEMSSEGALRGELYLKRCTEIAEQYPEFVVGLISQNRCTFNPGLVQLTPGVQLHVGGDSLGQRYRTPHQAIIEQGNDVVIVGRGIYKDTDPGKVAEMYRQQSWNAYLERVDQV